jgi:hypothetical protein
LRVFPLRALREKKRPLFLAALATEQRAQRLWLYFAAPLRVFPLRALREIKTTFFLAALATEQCSPRL